jgi:hypothetical protein
MLPSAEAEVNTETTAPICGVPPLSVTTPEMLPALAAKAELPANRMSNQHPNFRVISATSLKWNCLNYWTSNLAVGETVCLEI